MIEARKKYDDDVDFHNAVRVLADGVGYQRQEGSDDPGVADMAEQPHDETWAEANHDTAEFRALLRKYGGDFQKAVDAHRRGERVPLDGEADLNSPM